jgi:hypothetical protein
MEVNLSKDAQVNFFCRVLTLSLRFKNLLYPKLELARKIEANYISEKLYFNLSHLLSIL